MTAQRGMMPPALARYAANRQKAAKNTLDDATESGEQEGGDVLSALQRLVGEDATLTLLEEYGGTRMAVPQTASEGSRLSRLIGLDAAQLVSSQFGGRYVRLPLGRALRATVYRKRGWSYPKIAKSLCMTDSAVARMLNNLADAAT